MGLIEKQGIQGTAVTYLGVLLGFVTAGILLPLTFTQEQIGVLDVLNAWSLILATLATLGINNVTNRLFPWFRNQQNRHNGYLAILFTVLIAGLILAFGVYFLIRPYILQNAQETGELLPRYIDLILPLTVFSALFLILDIYYAVLYRSVKGIWHKELLQRVYILLAILAFIILALDFPLFVYLYVGAICLPGLAILLNLFYDREMTWQVNRNILSKELVGSMFSVAFFGVIVSFSNILIQKIDILMIQHFMETKDVGLYSRVFFYGTLVAIPLRVLSKISAVVTAQAWKDERHEEIDQIYRKSTMDQLLLGALVFIGLWGNIDNILRIIGQEYAGGQWVVFYIGLSNLFLMAAGVSGAIISTSRYYRVLTWFVSLFGISVVGFNLIFIPSLGIAGAALASALSALLYALLRFGFLWSRYRMQPYSYKHLLILVLAAVAYGANLLVPDVFDPNIRIPSLILDILLRSGVMAGIFLAGAWLLHLSPDLEQGITKLLKKFRPD